MPNRTCRAAALGLGLGITTTLVQSLGAQAPAAIEVGKRVRMSVTRRVWLEPIIATVDSVRADTLYFTTNQSRTLRSVSRGDIRSIEMSTGREAHPLGDAIGGAITGAAIGWLSTKDLNPLDDGCGQSLSLDSLSPDSCSGHKSTSRVRSATTRGALIGAAVGFLLGTTLKSDRWVPAALPISGISLGTRRSPLSVSLSLSF